MLLIAVAIEKENGFVVRNLIIFHNSDVLLVVSLNSLEGNHSLIPTIAGISATPTFSIFVENSELFSFAIVFVGDTIYLKPSVSLEFGVNGKLDVLNSWHGIIYVPSRV